MKTRQFHVKNQYVIEGQDCTLFQSYDSIIARKDNTGITLDTRTWDYSKTTGKYRNLFLGETKKETEYKIKSGEYKLADLNG